VLEGAVEAFGLLRDQENLISGLVLLARLFEQTDRSAEAYRRLSMALRHDADNLEIRAAMARNRHAAGRWRDTLAAIDPIEQRLDAGLELRPGQGELVSDLLMIAAECDIQLKQTERLAARYERAAALHPKGRKARAALATLCQDSGRLAEAAEHTRVLADMSEDPIERGRTLLRAGMLFHEAAGAAPEEGDDDSGPGVALRASAFECVRIGISLIADRPAPVLDRSQLEAAFWTAAPRNAGIALACLDRLLLNPDVKAVTRQSLLIEGARIARERDEPDDEGRALELARAALDTLPEAASGAHAVFDVLAMQERISELETLVLGFFDRVGRGRGPNPGETRDRQRLLTRLAELEVDNPDLAIRLLEQAAELDPQALDLESRRRLAHLYEAAAIEGPPVHDNDEALISLDPLDERGLASVARRCVEAGEKDRAHALYQVLRLVAPSHPEATAFLGKNDLTQIGNGKLDPTLIADKPPASGGVIAAMTQLWEGAAELICDELPGSRRPPPRGSRPTATATPCCGRCGPSSASPCRPRACASPTPRCCPASRSATAGRRSAPPTRRSSSSASSRVGPTPPRACASSSAAPCSARAPPPRRSSASRRTSPPPSCRPRYRPSTPGTPAAPACARTPTSPRASPRPSPASCRSASPAS
jgi:tetratricopeptide (TPR) repeat protein